MVPEQYPRDFSALKSFPPISDAVGQKLEKLDTTLLGELPIVPRFVTQWGTMARILGRWS